MAPSSPPPRFDQFKILNLNILNFTMKRAQSSPRPENIKKAKLPSETQEIKSINKLSDDVLNIIFERLEFPALKKATTVCTR